MNDINTCNTTACPAEAKWFAKVNDTRVPVPRRIITAGLLKSLASIAEKVVLLRDHNSSHDPYFDNEDEIDLAEGNVFIVATSCSGRSKGQCDAPAKRAISLDDKVEIVITPTFTYSTLCQLFSVPSGARVFRDFESPNDQVIEKNDEVVFADGPVFVTRCQGHTGPSSVTIIVEGTPHEWSKPKITHEEVVKLEVPGYPQNPPLTYSVKYKCGPSNKPEGILAPGASVKVKEGMVFNVSETGQS